VTSPARPRSERWIVRLFVVVAGLLPAQYWIARTSDLGEPYPALIMPAFDGLVTNPGWAVLVAGVVLTIVYGAIDNPVVLLLGSVGGHVSRDSLAMLAPCVLVALAAGRSVVERIAGVRSREPFAHPVLLFDGVCGLCSRAVDFVLAHDRGAVFRFAALQSAAWQAALARHRLPSDYSDSMVVIDGGRCYRYSTAVLHILRRLGMPWAALWPLVLVPPPFRDLLYEHVAARRYRWFGKLDTCRVPTAAERERFVADSGYN